MIVDDMDLVREYAANHSEQAFEELVGRHLNLVHSAALRRLGDAQLADDVTQAVFIILARKAGSLGPKTVLSGWLYRTTGYAAADALKSQRRRQHREQEAYMQSLLNETQPNSAWSQIAPLLDRAMDSLNERDRNALVMRFFEGKPMIDVGASLGLSGDGAKKVVHRALERLHKYFSRRGVASTTEAIGDSMSAHSVQAAPALLAKTVAAAALAKGAATTSAAAVIANHAMKLMSWAKAKFLIGAASAFMVGAMATVGTTTYFVSWFESRNETVDEKIAGLSAPGTTMKDAIRILGEPKRYWYNGNTLNKKKLPDSYMVTFQQPGIQAYVFRGYVCEWEAVGSGPGFSYHGKLRLGSSLDDVLRELGPPTEVYPRHTAKDFAEARLSGFGGVLYTDIGGKEGHCYYWRPEQNVRCMFKNNVIDELVIDVPQNGVLKK